MTWKPGSLQYTEGAWVLEGSPIPTHIEPHWNNDQKDIDNAVWHLFVGGIRETWYGSVDLARRRAEWLLLDIAQAFESALKVLLGEADE